MVTDVGTVQIDIIYHYHQSHLPERKVWVRVCGRFRDESPGLGKGCLYFKGNHARLCWQRGFSHLANRGGPIHSQEVTCN